MRPVERKVLAVVANWIDEANWLSNVSLFWFITNTCKKALSTKNKLSILTTAENHFNFDLNEPRLSNVVDVIWMQHSKNGNELCAWCMGRRRFREECWRSYSTFFLWFSLLAVFVDCGCGILFFLLYSRRIQLVQSTHVFLFTLVKVVSLCNLT